MSKVILLTGSVFVGATPLVTLTSTNIRLKNYIDSIKFYIGSEKIDKIVFVENTNIMSSLNYSSLFYDLVAEAKENGKILEILSFDGNREMVEEYGKGYGECENIEYALANSKTIMKDDLLIKITGRYQITNIDKLSKSISVVKPSFIRLGFEDLIDAFVFSFFIDTWHKYFLEAKSMINDRNGVYFEHVIFSLIKEKNINVLRLPMYPIFDQVSGSTGIKENRRYSIYRVLIYLGALSINRDENSKLLKVVKSLLRFKIWMSNLINH